jgi:hypothetical protein
MLTDVLMKSIVAPASAPSTLPSKVPSFNRKKVAGIVL